MTDFRDLKILRDGSAEQRRIYHLIQKTQILSLLSAFDPVVAGTFPLDIQVPASDVDIICEFKNPSTFVLCLQKNFLKMNAFQLRILDRLDPMAVVANFEMEGQQFEVFGQALPVERQLGFRHMQIEDKILKRMGDAFKVQVIDLKKLGVKTEPAFCQLLGIQGDPYLNLLLQEHLYS